MPSSDPRYRSHAWRKVRSLVLDRDGHRCQLAADGCEGQAAEVDHIISPRAGGSFYDPANLRASCKFCNRSRGARTRNVAGWRTAGTRITLVGSRDADAIDGPVIDRPRLDAALASEALGAVAYRLLMQALQRGELRVEEVSVVHRPELGQEIPPHHDTPAGSTENDKPPTPRPSRRWLGE